jgi:NADH-quinone oxidoreductase subunit K
VTPPVEGPALHLVGPMVLAAALAGIGVYGLLARRNAVLVLIGAELLLNAAGVLLVAGSALPSGGLAAMRTTSQSTPVEVADPLLAGQSLTIFLITIAAAEIGVALAVVLLLFRSRRTADLTEVRELGEASPTYNETPGAGDWPERKAPDAPATPAAPAEPAEPVTTT